MTRRKAEAEAERITREHGVAARAVRLPATAHFAVLVDATATNPQMIVHEPGWTPPATLYVP